MGRGEECQLSLFVIEGPEIRPGHCVDERGVHVTEGEGVWGYHEVVELGHFLLVGFGGLGVVGPACGVGF